MENDKKRTKEEIQKIIAQERLEAQQAYLKGPYIHPMETEGMTQRQREEYILQERRRHFGYNDEDDRT